MRGEEPATGQNPINQDRDLEAEVRDVLHDGDESWRQRAGLRSNLLPPVEERTRLGVRLVPKGLEHAALVVGDVCEAVEGEVEQVTRILVHLAAQHGVAAVVLARVHAG